VRCGFVEKGSTSNLLLLTKLDQWKFPVSTNCYVVGAVFVFLVALVIHLSLAGFKGKRPRGLHKTEIESACVIETSASIKSQNVVCVFLYYKESEQKIK
jgi:hypothetical protein